MPTHPPGKTQRRYRGKIRADMRSAYNHLKYLLRWDIKFRNAPATSYPNQLAPEADMQNVQTMIIQLNDWLTSLGEIPSR